MSCWQPQNHFGQAYTDCVLSPVDYIWKSDRYEQNEGYNGHMDYESKMRGSLKERVI